MMLSSSPHHHLGMSIGTTHPIHQNDPYLHSDRSSIHRNMIADRHRYVQSSSTRSKLMTFSLTSLANFLDIIPVSNHAAFIIPLGARHVIVTFSRFSGL